MSWAIPTAAGQWPTGMANMAMTTPDMSMGNYTPEQWTALQQQNWHQWAQWQQQYAQWQTQYGEKYAQQMQAMQAMGGMPPLPMGGTAPPAPPPPDKPPPPPPDQNNQPLFGSAPIQPVPVPPPGQRISNTGYNNSNLTGNNQSWSQGAADGQQDASQGAAVNAEALKKLAEEERLFDIQFQKWEEEIEKWKKENINHPDKEAYKEYEAKFEACRVQLLERRHQMNQRKARLLGNVPQQAHAAPTGNNQTQAVPPLMQKPISTPNFNQKVQAHDYNSSPNPKYSNQNHASKQYSDAPPAFNKSNNSNIELQDRYDSYQSMEDYSASANDFLPPSANDKGIPGLDLVPPPDKSATKQDVIDITGDNAHPVAPDYSTISKGINNILGDEKIMNILSMVKIQTGPGSNNAQNVPGGAEMPSGQTNSFGPGGSGGRGGPSGSAGPYNPNSNNYEKQQNKQWDRNDNQYNNQQFANQQIMPMNRQGPPPLMQQNVNPPSQNRMYSDGQNEMSHDLYYDRNTQYGGPNMGSMPPGGRPNMPPGRPPLQEMSGNQNRNDHYRGPHDNSTMLDDRSLPMHENRMPMNQPPPRPKWMEDPLFTPSIIVEYEHKPLRLKAREFIEPVHTFDYNHISKDEEYRKKDFEREVDELFTRKPRRLDDDYDNSERVSKFSMDGSDRFPPDRGDRFPPDRGDRYPPDRSDRFPPDRGDRFPPDRCDRFDPDRGDRFDPDRGDRFDPDRGDRFPSDRGDRFSSDRGDRFPREPLPPRDFERRPRDDREDIRSRGPPPRDEYDDRRRSDAVYFDRRRDDRDKFSRRDDYRDREDYRSRDDFRDRDRDRYRDVRRDEGNRRSRSRDRDSRKRGRSKDSEVSEHSKKSKDTESKPVSADGPKHVVMIDDILETPGREMRPEKIVIILRGPPGSGKSYLAKLIRDREAEYGGTARIMSIDDYFMQEGEVEEKDPNTGKIIKKQTMKYEYDESLEETYINSLKRAFKRSLTDGYFSFLIYDAVNDQLKSYADIWNFARQNGFQVYIITLELDPQICFKRNVHGRSLTDVEVVCSRFFPTPSHHIELDATTLLQSAAITDVTMEDAEDEPEPFEQEELMPKSAAPPQVESSFTSKWEKMDDVDKLARLDGTSKPLRPSQLSMEDYLQIDDWKPNKAAPGKKTVRWADIEERRQQEKMRAIGFVVGQTDWNRMTDPTMGSSALTQTKYIERVRRKQYP